MCNRYAVKTEIGNVYYGKRSVSGNFLYPDLYVEMGFLVNSCPALSASMQEIASLYNLAKCGCKECKLTEAVVGYYEENAMGESEIVYEERTVMICEKLMRLVYGG